MESPLNNHNPNFSDISSDSKKSSNYKKQSIQEKNGNHIDKEALNLFKDIVKVKRINSMKMNKSPILKYNSAENAKNFSAFIDKIYNNEEHLNNNEIKTINNLGNVLSKNNTISPRRNCLKMKKSLFNKEGSNSPKKSKKGNVLNNKGYGAIKYKSQKNYSFFFKLKEKNKFPSKTPYLDKKAFNSAFSLNQYNLEENANDMNDKPDNKYMNKI